MNIVKILSILTALMFIGIAAGVVYTEYNKTADAKMTLHHNNNGGFETLVSSDGINFSNSIIVDNVQGGDTVILTFRHTDNEPDNILSGNVVYKIECDNGLSFKDGQIIDFYNDGITDNEYEKLSGGLVFTNQNGITTNVNTPGHIIKIDDNTAEITSVIQIIQTFNSTVYTNLDITFHADACGEYTISGHVEEYIPDPTPTPEPTPNPDYISNMLCDFETGVNTDNDVNADGRFIGRGKLLPIDNIGALGSNYSVRFDAPEENREQLSFYIAGNIKQHIDENNGCNRLELYVKLPVGIETAKSYNFHMGTYVMPGETGDIYIDGAHYYHYYNLEGSEYWTKVIANQHPCHFSGSKRYIPDNPTYPEYNYMEGMTRFYLSVLANSQTNIADPWAWNIDEVRYYNEIEPENTESINSVSCSYFGGGHFFVRWYGNTSTNNLNHYELRYSDQPINNTNYDNAMIAPGCDDLTRMVTEHGTAYSLVSADFTIPITEGTAYFAMKDLTTGNPYCTKIDYKIFEP